MKKFLNKYGDDSHDSTIPGECASSSPSPPVTQYLSHPSSLSQDQTELKQRLVDLDQTQQDEEELDIGEQTRQQLIKMGIDMDNLSSHDRSFFRYVIQEDFIIVSIVYIIHKIPHLI